MIGETLGQYEILALLGKGGMGQGTAGANEIIVTLNFNKELERMAPVEKR